MSKPSADDEREAIVDEILIILRELLDDREGYSLVPETVLGSLGLDSVNLVYLIAELQQQHGLQDRYFKKVIAEAVDITGLRIIDLATHIHELRGRGSPSG